MVLKLWGGRERAGEVEREGAREGERVVVFEGLPVFYHSEGFKALWKCYGMLGCKWQSNMGVLLCSQVISISIFFYARATSDQGTPSQCTGTPSQWFHSNT